MLKKAIAQENMRAIAVLFFTLISIGCGSDGTFERPDSFEVTTLDAVHGQIGHRTSVMISKEGEEIARQLVLVLQDSDVSPTPIYTVLGYTSGAPYSPDRNVVSIVELIDYLHAAVSVDLVPSLPEGVKQKGGIMYGGNTLLCYLQVTTPSETLYWSVRTSQKGINEVLAYLEKPPEVLDTRPEVGISYYSDENLTQPIVGDEIEVGDTIYTKVVFPNDVPIVIADDDRAQPHIWFQVYSGVYRYHIKSPGTPLKSGEERSYQGSRRVFVCKYTITIYDRGGQFSVSEDPFNANSLRGETLQVVFYQFTGEIPPNTGATITSWQPNDFVGQVYTPSTDDVVRRDDVVPVAGVTVTIVDGPRAGESIVTDRNGRYLFPNVAGDSLHLRVHRPHFEPKEAIVHRSQPLRLTEGSVPNYRTDIQKQPGSILIGLSWPDEVRFILEGTLLPYDLLYVSVRESPYAGHYSEGMAVTREDLGHTYLHTVAHEIAHAHQNAVVFIDGRSGDESRRHFITLWKESPEGKAFAAAWAKDWAEIGDDLMEVDTDPYYRNDIAENAAEVSAYYWGLGKFRTDHRVENLKENAPNRYRWAAEWLPKK